jgi:LacI family transcriptional regulator
MRCPYYMAVINDSKGSKARVGMKDIAKKTGVSISTVSLVLNGKPGVSSDVREQVIEVAKELGYGWKGFYETNVNTYSVIFPSSLEPFMQNMQTDMSNGIYGEYLAGFDVAAQELNVNLNYVPNLGGDMGELFNRILEEEAFRTRGAIFCSITRLDDFALSFFRERKIPVVLLNKMVEASDMSYVSINYPSATYHMVSQLLKKGCKRVIYLGHDPKRDIIANMRIRAYTSALRDNGMEVNQDLILLNRPLNEIASAIASIGDDLGVFASTLGMVRLLLEAIRPLGLRAGRDFKLAGGEFLKLMEGIDFNTMDTVRLPYFDSAYYALKAIDTLSNDVYIKKIRMLLDWEYMPGNI